MFVSINGVDFTALRRWALIATASSACLLLLACPERPPRYVEDEEVDAGPVVFSDAALRRWEHCPPRARALPIEGGLWVQTTPNTVYCTANRTQFFTEPVNVAFDNLVQVRLVPDDLFLPLEEGVHQVEAASCLQRQPASGRTGEAANSGTWTVERPSVLGTERIEGVFLQPFPDGSALRVSIAGLTSTFPQYPTINGGGVLLDGIPRPQAVAPSVRLALCDDATCEQTQTLMPCALLEASEGPTRFDQVDIVFDRGELSMILEVNESDETQSVLRKAAGTFEGEEINIETFTAIDSQWFASTREYGRSVRSDFTLRLPSIDGICGLWLLDFNPAESQLRLLVSRCDSVNVTAVSQTDFDYQRDVEFDE